MESELATAPEKLEAPAEPVDETSQNDENVVGQKEENEDQEEEKKSDAVADDDSTPSYLAHDQFSSERFKLEIRNLPVAFGFGQIKKLLTSLNLKYVKLKAPGSSLYAYVTFVNEEARQEAFQKLNKYKYKGKELEAIYSKPAQDPVAAKRKNTNDNNDNSKHKKSDSNSKSNDSNLSLEERVQNSVTPLWNLGYEDQIEQKSKNVKQILRKCLFKMEKSSKDIFYWLQKQRLSNEGMPCPLTEFEKSPVVDNYRNKCEFTIGYNVTERENVIGFRLGDFKSGSNEVVHVDSCKHIPNETKLLLKRFQAYVDQSKYKPFNVRNREGNWRQLTVRSNEKNEFLVIVIFDKQDLTDEDIANEKKLLVEYFNKDIEQNDYNLKSLLFNVNTNKTGISKMDNLDVLFGEDFNFKCLYEDLLGLKFRISPLAFFQANTKAAEVLYKKIGDICDIDENTVLLDICCGTGTIGLTLAKRVKLVVGVEIIQEAIEDAKLNAKLNNIENVEFHCGKAEDVLPELLKRFTKERVIAIVDPPRAGLHNKVIQTLRRLENLKSLIYVSCNAELAMQNFIDLARDSSKNYLNNPFVPLKAIGVDMFPHTVHFELILYFQRYSTELFSSK